MRYPAKIPTVMVSRTTSKTVPGRSRPALVSDSVPLRQTPIPTMTAFQTAKKSISPLRVNGSLLMRSHRTRLRSTPMVTASSIQSRSARTNSRSGHCSQKRTRRTSSKRETTRTMKIPCSISLTNHVEPRHLRPIPMGIDLMTGASASLGPTQEPSTLIWTDSMTARK